MTPREHCQSAEAGLDRVRQLLLEPCPGAFEQCLPVLSQVIETLESLAAGTRHDWDPAVHQAFHRIRASARTLQPQIEHGSNLVRGLMQLRFGAGYTPGGLPVFTEREAESLFEA